MKLARWAAVAVLFALGLFASYAVAATVTEIHTYTETFDVVVRGKTTKVAVTGTITDVDTIPDPVTVTQTVTVTAGTTTTAPDPYAVAAPIGPLEVHDGGGTQAAGSMNYTTGPLLVEKKLYRNYTGWGVFAMQWPEQPSTGLVEIRDVRAEHVMANPPMSGGGTKEAAFWLGQWTRAERLEADDISWMAYWFGGNFDGSLVQNIRATRIQNVAAYFEHAARNSIVRNCHLEANVVGDGGWVHPGVVNFEWAYADGYAKYMPSETQVRYPGRSSAYNITLEYCTIRSLNPDAPCIFIGPGVFGIKLSHLRLEGCRVGVEYTNQNLHPSIPVVEIDWSTVDVSGVLGPREVIRTDLAIG